MRTALSAAAVCLLWASIAAADVTLTFNHGRVSVVAKEATVRQVLTEWARVGQTKVVNVEGIPGDPQTLELSDVPEEQALAVLLRAVSGYVTTSRAEESVGVSQFDSLFIMPASVAPKSAAAAQTPAPVVEPPPSDEPAPLDRDSEDRQPASVGQFPNQNRGPSPNFIPAQPPPEPAAMPIADQPPLPPEFADRAPVLPAVYPGAVVAPAPPGRQPDRR